MKIYLAASSAELERARRWSAALTAKGFDVCSRWIDLVAELGGNPAATPAARCAWAAGDLRDVRACDLLWLLVPPLTAPTRGAWIEYGFAYAIGRRVIASGPTDQSIFCALGPEFPTDERAFSWLLADDAEGAREAMFR